MGLQQYTPLEQAKYKLVNDYPGGAVALAPLVRMNRGTLSNKVNPDVETHHLTVDEAVSIQAFCKQYHVLYAEAAALGHVCIPLPQADADLSDAALLDIWAEQQAEDGETAAAIRAALKDGDITKAEYQEIHKEVFEDFQAKLALLQRLGQLAGVEA